MLLASEDDLKHLRYLINGQSSDKPVSSDNASNFYKMLFPHCAMISPYDLRRYANGEDPMPKSTYEMLVNLRLGICD